MKKLRKLLLFLMFVAVATPATAEERRYAQGAVCQSEADAQAFAIEYSQEGLEVRPPSGIVQYMGGESTIPACYPLSDALSVVIVFDPADRTYFQYQGMTYTIIPGVVRHLQDARAQRVRMIGPNSQDSGPLKVFIVTLRPGARA